VDAKGRPVLEFDLNGDTGHTIATQRASDGSEVYIKEKDILDINRIGDKNIADSF